MTEHVATSLRSYPSVIAIAASPRLLAMTEARQSTVDRHIASLLAKTARESTVDRHVAALLAMTD